MITRIKSSAGAYAMAGALSLAIVLACLYLFDSNSAAPSVAPVSTLGGVAADNASAPAAAAAAAAAEPSAAKASELSSTWTDQDGKSHTVLTRRLAEDTIDEWVSRHATQLEEEKALFPPAPSH